MNTFVELSFGKSVLSFDLKGSVLIKWSFSGHKCKTFIASSAKEKLE
jgi:hypothetical protein